MRGWRRSAYRASLYVKSLLSGNFTGKNAISGFLGPISWREAAVPHQFLAQFPTQINRETISKNREFLARNRECDRPNRQRTFGHVTDHSFAVRMHETDAALQPVQTDIRSAASMSLKLVEVGSNRGHLKLLFEAAALLPNPQSGRQHFRLRWLERH